ncbi:hypothetical protein EMIT0347P_20391 [Pseudomonas sp. IT-347P]
MALAASRILSRGKNDVMGRSGKGTGFLCPKNIFIECFLHEWNIAGSVPYARRRWFIGV